MVKKSILLKVSLKGNTIPMRIPAVWDSFFQPYIINDPKAQRKTIHLYLFHNICGQEPGHSLGGPSFQGSLTGLQSRCWRGCWLCFSLRLLDSGPHLSPPCQKDFSSRQSRHGSLLHQSQLTRRQHARWKSQSCRASPQRQQSPAVRTLFTRHKSPGPVHTHGKFPQAGTCISE